MSVAPLLGAASAALGVAGAWEALGALELMGAGHALGRAVAVLTRTGRDGREPTAPERRRLALLCAGCLLVGGWIVVSPLAGLALATGGPWFALAAVRRRRRRYGERLERAAPAAARSLADALAAGRSIRGAIAEAAGSLGGPAGIELRAARAALEVGEATETVLERLRARAQGRVWTVIVAAVLLQRQAGGDLAGILRSIAAAHEETLRIEHDARAATAQARFTGLLVCGLPAGAAVLAELGSPGYLASVARAPLPATLAAMALALQLGSALAIRRLARVRR